MKILLDENLPKKLKHYFQGYEIFTVRDMGWHGKTNGELIKLLIAGGFDLLITFDKNLQHQQNFEEFPITVLALSASDNTYATVKQLVPKIKRILSEPLTIGVTGIKL